MRFEEGLYLQLKNHTGLQSLAADRVYPLVIPQNARLPAVTYQKISGFREHCLQKDSGYTTPVFQISCWAESYASVKALAEQVRFCLQDFSGLLGGEGGVEIKAVLLQGELEGYEPDTKTYYLHLEFCFHYIEPLG